MNDNRDSNKQYVTACVDGSSITESVVDTAAWASTSLAAPLKFLHILEKAATPISDRSGAILPDSATHLLDELTELDEKRGKLAMALGKHVLEDAQKRALDAGVGDVSVHQRHGDLLEGLQSCEARTRVFVIGRFGEDHEQQSQKLGAHFESLVRAITTPIVVAVRRFSTPQSFMIAYDGSRTADKAIAGIAQTPLLKSMQGHVVMVGADNDANRESLGQATAALVSGGHTVDSHLLQGHVVEQLSKFRATHEVGLLVMGAYGHSRVRDFFVGSNTSKMIASSAVPLLLLR